MGSFLEGANFVLWGHCYEIIEIDQGIFYDWKNLCNQYAQLDPCLRPQGKTLGKHHYGQYDYKKEHSYYMVMVLHII